MVCGGLTLEQVYPEGLQPVERTDAGVGEKCEVEGVAERSCYILTATPQCPSPCTAWGVDWRKESWERRSEAGPGKKSV